MTINETVDFLKRIKANYQEFSIKEKYIIDEWYRELQNYDLADLNEKLDEHLADDLYGREIPKVRLLTKDLIRSKDKGKVKKYLIYCNNCGQVVGDREYDRHYKRCSAVSAMISDLKNYYNLTVKKEELLALSEKKFELSYQKYLYKMLEADIPYLRKKIILHLLYPNEEIDIETVAKKMANKE